ncbi:MAG TPA: nuclear transport factor 2 family protein [Polyangiales bacterium]
MAKKTIFDAFSGEVTTLEEQRRIWPEALHEDAIWEGPTFEKPVCVIGREATARFMELLLSVVPRFKVKTVAAYPTSDPETVIAELHGGGPTTDGKLYTQRYFSLITRKQGQTFRMREYCNPFQTYQAFGKERWEQAVDEIMARYNKPWPASQPPDPITMPPLR